MEKAESQGHRLSSYASSSSNKHSPKTPKKSTEKLSTRSTSKEESLSPHHLISGYSYTSINSQSKDLQTECVLKCTCNNNSSYNSLKSLKSSGGDKAIIKLAKVSCDAATSPSHFNQRSPQSNLRLINNKTNPSTCNELRISDEKKIINKPTPSPRRLIATRNAATSPNLDVRKPMNHELLPKSPEITKSQLEKSNSLGDSKPNRTLRTTRSLSPRPPVRHQHAIMVSDENDIVSVKVSPNEDYELDVNKSSEVSSGAKKKHKAQSEQTSPNLSDYETAFSYERSANNKSTGCLVYVPSDPWLKMSEVEDIKKSPVDVKGKKKISKFSHDVRSLSRGNLEPIDKDPWIWRKPHDLVNVLNQSSNIKRSPKQELYRQTKSFSVTKFDFNDAGKKDTNSAKLINRPKLQRCKSPLIIDDELTTFLTDTPHPCTCITSNEKPSSTVTSPRKDETQQQKQQQQQSSSSLTVQPQPTSSLTAPQKNKTFLNVVNPNIMQSRHSFSSISQKDDELQLNIRRLSEQIKHNNACSSGADFTDYLNQFRCSEAQKAKATTTTTRTSNNSSKNSDSVLETTC